VKSWKQHSQQAYSGYVSVGQYRERSVSWPCYPLPWHKGNWGRITSHRVAGLSRLSPMATRILVLICFSTGTCLSGTSALLWFVVCVWLLLVYMLLVACALSELMFITLLIAMHQCMPKLLLLLLLKQILIECHLVKITSRTLIKVKMQNNMRCTQLGKIEVNDGTKRCIFRRRLKVLSVPDAVMLDGKVFQMHSAAKNARSPIVVRHEDGVTRADIDVGRSLFLVSTSATRRSSLTRYGRAVPCRHRKTSIESLNSVHSGTHSHWRSQSSRLMCS